VAEIRCVDAQKEKIQPHTDVRSTENCTVNHESAYSTTPHMVGPGATARFLRFNIVNLILKHLTLTMQRAKGSIKRRISNIVTIFALFSIFFQTWLLLESILPPSLPPLPVSSPPLRFLLPVPRCRGTAVHTAVDTITIMEYDNMYNDRT
jgi:hypothetical protein